MIKVVFGATPGPPARTTTPQSVFAQVTQVPTSTYDTVGVSSPVVAIVPPSARSGQPPLRFSGPDSSAASLPGVFFWGAEYCSFCAAERWALVTALSRFGTFHSLHDMASSPVGFAASTPTFTFYTTKYSSPYIDFEGVEAQSNDLTSKGFATLMQTTPQQQSLISTYDPTASYPFVDIGNRVIATNAAFSPEALATLSSADIAQNLSDPSNPVTQVILASSNYLSAGICAIDGEQPAQVCTSSGVVAAAHALGLR